MWYICDFFYFALFSYVILPLLWFFFLVILCLGTQYFSGRSEGGTGVLLQCAVNARKINRNVEDGCMLLILYVFSSL